MKKIAILFFTFSGIYTGFAQGPGEKAVPDSLQTGRKENVRPAGIDSLAGKEKLAMRLFPNPTANRVEVVIKGFEAGFVLLQIIDNNHTIMKEDKRLLLSGNETIVVMFSLAPGLYFLNLKQGNRSCKRKLVVQ